MKLIVEIGYSEIESINATPKSLCVGVLYRIQNFKKLVAVMTRYVLKLREIGFYLPDFDHIAICLTPDIQENEVRKPDTIDRYHQFFSEYYIGVSPDNFNHLSEDQQISFLLDKAVEIIRNYYCNSDEEKKKISRCAEIVLKNGENEEIIFKEKRSDNHIAQVIVKVLDFNTFKAYVRVFDNQEMLKEYEYPRDLGRFELPFQFGTIIINKSAVKIKPKKNSLSSQYGFEEIRVEF